MMVSIGVLPFLALGFFLGISALVIYFAGLISTSSERARDAQNRH